MKNIIIWIEDRPDTIVDQISFCKSLGFDVRVVGTAHRLAESLKTEKNHIKLIILDIMLFSITSFDSIGIVCSQTEIDSGYNTGWVIIDKLLRADKVNDYKNIPILIVSIKKQTELDKLRIFDGAWIDYIEKGTLSWTEQFKSKIKELYLGNMDIQIALSMIMPNGKYKGKLLDDIPSPYLKWVAESFSEHLISIAADIVWNWREEMNVHEYD